MLRSVRVDMLSEFVMMTSSDSISSISFLNHVIVFVTGIDLNLQMKTASCPSLIVRCSILNNFGMSVSIRKKREKI